MGQHSWLGYFFYLCFAVVLAQTCDRPLDPVRERLPIQITPENPVPKHKYGPPITIQSPFNLSLLTNASDFYGSIAESIYYTLPDIISMHRPDFDDDTVTNLVNQYTLVLADAAIDAMRHNTNITAKDLNGTCPTVQRHHHKHGDLQRRDLFGDIGDFFGDLLGGIVQGAEDLACAAFALGANPGFVAADGIFHNDNNRGIPLTDDQMFFIHAAMGSNIPSGIAVTYSASFPFFFPGETAGITFDTDIYIRGGAVTTTTYNTGNIFTIDPNFATTTAIVLHETQHVRQYQGFGWNVWNFGYQYFYAYCQAGFKYSGNHYEQEAFATQFTIYPLFNEPYSAFFNIWGAFNLKSKLGFPNTVSPSVSTWNGESTELLGFDKGVLEIRPKAKCFRAWTGGDWGTLYAGNCQIVNVPVFHRTKPCPPQCGKPPNAAAIKAHNTACTAARKKAVALKQSKAWTCIKASG
jgi:hypothetical protein